MIDLREKYGKRYKVTLESSWEGGNKIPFYEIVGKKGYIRPWGTDLELYITSAIIAGRLERQNTRFKAKNHYDDATSFVFKEEHLPEACKYIRAKNRRQMTPEGLERLKIMRSKLAKPLVDGASSQ